MSFLEKVFAGFNEADALRDLDRALRLNTEAQVAFDQAKRQLDHAAIQLATIRDTISAWERFTGRTLRPSASEVSQQNAAAAHTNGATGGRAAIRKLFAESDEGTEWTTPTVADALGLGKEHHGTLQVHLSRLARDGEILRLRTGVYTKLPTATVAPGAEEEGRESAEGGPSAGG